MSRQVFLLLGVVAAVLFAGLAGVPPAASGSAVAFAPGDLRASDLQAGDLSREHRPALTRGGFAMAALEAPRRKARGAQRPPTDSPILTSRFRAEALARSDTALRPWPDPPLRQVQADRPFPARGPPVWILA